MIAGLVCCARALPHSQWTAPRCWGEDFLLGEKLRVIYPVLALTFVEVSEDERAEALHTRRRGEVAWKFRTQGVG